MAAPHPRMYSRRRLHVRSSSGPVQATVDQLPSESEARSQSSTLPRRPRYAAACQSPSFAGVTEQRHSVLSSVLHAPCLSSSSGCIAAASFRELLNIGDDHARVGTNIR